MLDLSLSLPSLLHVLHPYIYIYFFFSVNLFLSVCPVLCALWAWQVQQNIWAPQPVCAVWLAADMFDECSLVESRHVLTLSTRQLGEQQPLV